MPTAAPRKTHRIPHRPPFECIALLLQGGGALGAYQAGVYEALAEAGIHPDWVAGISIGAINAAIIAGNPPERRVEKLRQFWELVTTPPSLAPVAAGTQNGPLGDFMDRATGASISIGAMSLAWFSGQAPADHSHTLRQF